MSNINFSTNNLPEVSISEGSNSDEEEVKKLDLTFSKHINLDEQKE